MKRLSLFLTTMVSTAGLNAQSIQPDVAASAGEHFVGANAQLSFTAGEAIIETVTGTNAMITQGFHQPDPSTGSTVEENLPPFIEVNIFPNPSAEEVTVNLEGNSMDMELSIFDMTGKLVSNRNIPAFQHTTKVDVRNFANANYLLNIHSLDNKHSAIYKIQKTR